MYDSYMMEVLLRHNLLAAFNVQWVSDNAGIGFIPCVYLKVEDAGFLRIEFGSTW